jgi:hypothetical protein
MKRVEKIRILKFNSNNPSGDENEDTRTSTLFEEKRTSFHLVPFSNVKLQQSLNKSHLKSTFEVYFGLYPVYSTLYNSRFCIKKSFSRK